MTRVVCLLNAEDTVHAVCRLKAPEGAMLPLISEEGVIVYLLLLAGSESHPVVFATYAKRCFRDWISFCKGAELDVLPLDRLMVPGCESAKLQDHTCRGKQGKRMLRFGIAFRA